MLSLNLNRASPTPKRMQFQPVLVWAAGLIRPSEYIWQPKVSTFSSAAKAGTASAAMASIAASSREMILFICVCSSRLLIYRMVLLDHIHALTSESDHATATWNSPTGVDSVVLT